MKVPIPANATVAKVIHSSNQLRSDDQVYVVGCIQDCEGFPCVLVVRIEDGTMDMVYANNLQAIDYFKKDGLGCAFNPDSQIYEYSLGKQFLHGIEPNENKDEEQ